MDFTMKDVMDLDVMSTSHVRTAEHQLRDRVVESISVIEIPVENFVREHEFVLTTGVGCGHDPELIPQFVSDVMRCGAAALAIATGRHIMNIPKKVIQLAEEHNFPIIEVPWEVRFSDITSNVLNALNDIQRATLKQSEQIQSQLLNLVLNSSDLTAIADFVYRMIETPLIIVDRQGKILSKSQNAETLANNWAKSLEFGFTTYYTAEDAHKISGRQQMFYKVGSHRFLKIPIRSSSELQGYFIMSIPRGESIDSFVPLEKAYILEHASTAAALTFLRTNMIQSTQTRLRNNFVWNLANGDIDSWDSVSSQATFLDYHLSQHNVCLLAKLENLSTIFNKSVREMPFETWSDKILERLEGCIQDITNTEHCNLLTTHHLNNLIVFYGISDDETLEASLNALIESMENRIRDVIEGAVLSWGIGNYHEGVQSFHQSYKEAQLALNLGERRKGHGHRTHYAEVSLNEAFIRFANDKEMKKISLSLLGRLFEYDRQKNMDLVETLRTYLRNQCNVSQTSRDINIHRQTLIYRLRKIESLTDRSLVDPDDLFLLDLSLRISAATPISSSQNENEDKDNSFLTAHK